MQIRLFKNHNSTIGYWECWTTSEGVVHSKWATSLTGKPTCYQYRAEPMNVGKANETTPLEQAEKELLSAVKRKKDKGYVDTMKEAELPCTNSLGLLKPMLATPINKIKAEKIDWKNAFVQPKLDGHRALYTDGILYSRTGQELNLPHVVKAIKASGLGHLHLDGELYIHGYTLQELSSLIKKQQHGTQHLEYHIYDIVNDKPFVDRYAAIILADTSHSHIKVVETTVITDNSGLVTLHKSHLSNHYEGSILRMGRKGYQDGKRSRNLLKLKEFQDAEFEIIGVESGKPHIGAEGTFQVPIWKCAVGNGETFTVTAQGKRHEKHQLHEESAQHIGKKLTVKYHYLSKLGVPQLPVALRFFEGL